VSLRIDIRSKRVRSGRLTLDAKTRSKVEWRHREAAVRALIDQGETAIIEGLRNRQLDIADVTRAVRLKDPARERALRELRYRVTGQGGPTLAQAVDRVLALSRRPNTQRLYEGHARRMLAHFGSDKVVADVLTSDAETFLTSRQWSAGYQHGARMFGSIVWETAIRDEEERAEKEGRAPFVTRNIWRRAQLPDYRSNRVEFLRPEEWVMLREKVRGLPSAALLALGCRAGLRAEETTHLRTGIDVDLDRRIIRIRERKGAFAWQPKSKHGERDVPIPDDLLEILTGHVASGYAGRTFLLHSPGFDRPISHTLIIKWTRAGFNAAGIQYGRKKDALTFHSLRHTFASWLTQAGMHPKKVARLIGDTPEMVLKVYGHLAEDDHDEAVALLNAAVEKTGAVSGEKSGDENDEVLGDNE
jgi:integrase